MESVLTPAMEQKVGISWFGKTACLVLVFSSSLSYGDLVCCICVTVYMICVHLCVSCPLICISCLFLFHLAPTPVCPIVVTLWLAPPSLGPHCRPFSPEYEAAKILCQHVAEQQGGSGC